jgi:hypothetical protein
LIPVDALVCHRAGFKLNDAHQANRLSGPWLASPDTVRPILGGDVNSQGETIEPRFGVIMNPYTQAPVVRQLFVSEPFIDAIAIVGLTTTGTPPNQVFSVDSVSRISSPALNSPVDLTPVVRDADNVHWASANQGDNTIVCMQQDGTVVAIHRVTIDGHFVE